MTTPRRRAHAAAVLAVALLAGCDAPAPPPSSSPSPGGAAAVASLAIEPESFDFGRVLPDRVLRKAFQLRNLGREAVAIDSVTTDCGCMVVGQYARQLAAGASTTLTVELHTPAQGGTLARTLVVKTAGANPTSLQLQVRATVVGGEGKPAS